MKEPMGITVTKPVSVLNKALNLNFKEFFKSIGKVAILGFAGDWKGAGTQAVDAISAVGLGKNWEDFAWLLIYRSLSRAMFNLIREDDLIRQKPDDPDKLCQQLDLSIEDLEITLDHNFFDRPKEISVVASIKKPFFQWLRALGLNEAEAQAIVDRFPRYFVFALNEEWRNRSEDYVLLKDKLQTPFIKATEKEQGWLQYSAWLQKQIDERMFEEAFSLRQIYVPLRAYYEEEIKEEGGEGVRLYPDEKQSRRVVVNLEEQLESWIQKADRRDAIRVISGGPGCGKSSFAKIFAAHQAEKDTIPILFIPLYRFELAEDLVEAVGNFVRFDPFLSHNPLDPESGEPRMLIIFDGLDEFSMQGKVGLEISQKFCQEIDRQITHFNHATPRLQVLISGRELVVQENMSEFRKPQQVLYLLPYLISEELRKSYTYIDNQGLLDQDQRDVWWTFYGKASGKGYQGIPPELKLEKLKEITSQPLLNYLVALSYDRKKIDFTQEINMNRIYKDLISRVYERGWAGDQHPGLKGVPEDNFFRILEEIGISAWHGDGMTTTVSEIEAHCEHGGLIKILLDKFQEGAIKGVTRLLTAFYFRQAGARSGGEPTFEFTNKSFGEYLICRRIIRSLHQIQTELERHQSDPDSGRDEKATLKIWAEICGPTAMDEYIFNFILEEMKLQDATKVNKWQETFCKLISFMLRYGMPIEIVAPRPPTFQMESKIARNSEEAMLAVLNCNSQDLI
jgi:hypothetical protein